MTIGDVGEPDLSLEPPSKRRFAARRVQGYLVLGPIPPRSRWLPSVMRAVLALMLPFWIYSPALAIWFLAFDVGNAGEDVMFPILYAFAAVSVAAGVYPLATWPCRWPFRLAATFVWATVLGAVAFPWTMLIVSYLE